MNTSLNPKSLGLVLAGQPIGILADLTAEFDKADQRVAMEIEPTGGEGQINIAVEVDIQPGVSQGEGVETGGVRETLIEVLADAEPSVPSSCVVKMGP